MSRRRRSSLDAEARRALLERLRPEGAKVRKARRRRRWTQAQLAEKVGVSQSTISKLELGAGGALSLHVWQRVAMALDLPLTVTLGRDALEDPLDAGHLAVQELVLRLGRRAGYARSFELPTKPADPRLSTDIGLVDHVRRRLVLVECVSTFGNVGSSVRASVRKQAEARALAISLGNGEPYDVHAVWVVRATRRNRALTNRYPELFETQFNGSSRVWVRALAHGAQPPAGLGLVWCDVAATRIFELRSRR